MQNFNTSAHLTPLVSRFNIRKCHSRIPLYVEEKERDMLHRRVAYPEQLRVLTKALQQYCRLAHIQAGTPAYDDAGRLIMVLFESGISSPEELARALRASDRRVRH